MERREFIAQNLAQVRQDVARWEQEAHREAGSVSILPVTKFHPVTDIKILKELGVGDVGENREQEARAKAAECPDVRFHMIGQVQTKKASAVARWAYACHSVDSVKLARHLQRGMDNALARKERLRETLECFIQLSMDGDSARGGIPVTELAELAEFIEDARYLRLAGLMVVPPLAAEPLEVFHQVRGLTDELSVQVGRPLKMSAGMSGDMSAAIFAGTDIVRVGTAIVGSRPLP